eukprot:6102523-Heterocapsa_arctica.AAC.1
MREAAGKPGEAPRRRIRRQGCTKPAANEEEHLAKDDCLVASQGLALRAPNPPPAASPPPPPVASQAALCSCSGNCGGR